MPNSLRSTLNEIDRSPNLAVLILAAGLSRRLGQPKQLLLKNKKPLIHHIAELAIGLNPYSIVVITNSRVEISSCLNDLPLQLVQNPQADTGMASSLKIGAECLKDHRGSVVILGVDQPLLDADYLQQLVQYSLQQPAMNIVSHYAQTIGIPAIVQPELLQQTHNLSGDSGLKKLLMQQPNTLIKVPAPQLVFDIDTPEDLIHARQQGWID
ncbi:MAG: nucleotidyltransferase family protein [Moraxellaceae bacterium]|nr:MAG: nucleotidyltransferase family protein [Moraxellaceae bacterium]